MRILVTGGEGNIGKRLVPKLMELKHTITLLLRQNKLSSGRLVKIVKGDLLNQESLLKATENIDLAVHLAGITHTNNQKLYYDINTKGTKNLIAACQKNKVKKIIYISSRTAGVDGGAYAHSKLLAEGEIKKSSMDWIILRVAEVYGAGEKEAITRLVKTVQNSFFVPIIGNGEYKLAPVFIDDVVSAIISSVKTKFSKKTYIVAGPDELTYNELVDKILSYSKLKRIKIHIPVLFLKIITFVFFIFKKDILVRDQIPRLISKKPSDIKDAHQDLHFSPITFEQGLKVILRNS